jgi:hypothetical protein
MLEQLRIHIFYYECKLKYKSLHITFILEMYNLCNWKIKINFTILCQFFSLRAVKAIYRGKDNWCTSFPYCESLYESTQQMSSDI